MHYDYNYILFLPSIIMLHLFFSLYIYDNHLKDSKDHSNEDILPSPSKVFERR